MTVATVIISVVFVIFQIFPYQVVSIFGNQDALYTEFSVKCLKIYLLLLPVSGIRMLGSSFLQAVGKPLPATILSISKQVAIQLPAMFILTSYIGVDGVLWSGPVSDLISFILTILVLFIVCKKIFNKRQTS